MGIKRRTKSVELLMGMFNENTNAISVIELIKRVQPVLNKTTVYRVLENLEDDGVLHSFLNSNGIKCYAICNACNHSKHEDEHPHFHCIDCGKIDCLSFDIKIPKIQNREIINSQILIQGRCESCFGYYDENSSLDC